MANSIPTLSDDPCGRAAKLRALRDQLITGGGVIEFESDHGNGVRRQVRYAQADLPRLDQEIAAAEVACGDARGARRRKSTFYPSTSKGV